MHGPDDAYVGSPQGLEQRSKAGRLEPRSRGFDATPGAGCDQALDPMKVDGIKARGLPQEPPRTNGRADCLDAAPGERRSDQMEVRVAVGRAGPRLRDDGHAHTPAPATGLAAIVTVEPGCAPLGTSLAVTVPDARSCRLAAWSRHGR